MRNSYHTAHQEQQEEPNSPPPNVVIQDLQASSQATTHSFSIYSAIVTVPLSTNGTIFQEVGSHEIAIQDIQHNLASRRTSYDGISSSCEGESFDKENQETHIEERGLQQTLTWLLELFHKPCYHCNRKGELRKEESRPKYDRNPRGIDLPEHADLDQFNCDVGGLLAMATTNAQTQQGAVNATQCVQDSRRRDIGIATATTSVEQKGKTAGACSVDRQKAGEIERESYTMGSWGALQSPRLYLFLSNLLLTLLSSKFVLSSPPTTVVKSSKVLEHYLL